METARLVLYRASVTLGGLALSATMLCAIQTAEFMGRVLRTGPGACARLLGLAMGVTSLFVRTTHVSTAEYVWVGRTTALARRDGLDRLVPLQFARAVRLQEFAQVLKHVFQNALQAAQTSPIAMFLFATRPAKTLASVTALAAPLALVLRLGLAACALSLIVGLGAELAHVFLTQLVQPPLTVLVRPSHGAQLARTRVQQSVVPFLVTLRLESALAVLLVCMALPARTFVLVDQAMPPVLAMAAVRMA